MRRITGLVAPLFLLIGLLAAGPAGAATTASYVVVLDQAVADPGAAAAQLTRAHGGEVGFVYRHAVKGFSLRASAASAAALARSPLVAYVEADQVYSVDAQSVPTGVRRIFADDNAEIDIDGTDDFRVDVDVAVIDTGIDLDHPDLNVVASTNCSGGGPFKRSCGSGGNDGHGHGTHVAGTIGAIDNDQGVVGVAPGARLWAVKVLSDNGSGYTSWILAGLDYVVANADAIEVGNMSLGGSFSQALNDGVAGAVDAGVTMVVAAGNSDADAADFSPASEPKAITVSALADFNGEPGGGAASTCRSDQDDTLADFSNWGHVIDIAAPGVCINSTWINGGYNVISGTSMAAPHVAGAAALLASGNSSLSPGQIDSTLESNGNLNWTDDSGDGVTERLLDVSNSNVFNPALVAGGGGGGGGGEGLTLTGSSTSQGSTWTATVNVSGASSGQVISGSWENGTSGGCTANSAGDCSFSRSSIPKRTGSVTWTGSGSEGSITISKP